eukprot:CCRYP_004537-RA/>CCRYP_004537-RA protein AED:0.47 eAED:0.59 QI:0/0/0/1/0/0/2/0/135
MHSPHIIAFQAVDHVTNTVYNDSNTAWHPSTFLTSSPSDLAIRADTDIAHICAGVVHPTTGETITSYKKLIACPLLRDVWTTAFGKEFGNLAQGDRKTERNEHNVCHDTYTNKGHTTRPYHNLRTRRRRLSPSEK